MDFTSGEMLFHVFLPWSNIDFLENCGLNRGVLIERLLRVSYVVRIRQESILMEYVRDCTIELLRHKYRGIVFD